VIALRPWLERHPLLASFLAGLAVCLAVALLVAEQLRDTSKGGETSGYYSQF